MTYDERCAVTMDGKLVGYVVIEARDGSTRIHAEIVYRNASPRNLGVVASKEEGVALIADRFASHHVTTA